MRSVMKGAMVMTVVALLGAGSVQAQAGVQFGLGGGVTIPTSSDFDDNFKLGWNGQVGIGFTPATLPVGFEATGNFLRNSNQTSGLDIKSQIISGSGNVVYTFATAETSRFHPYILGGGGVYNLKFTGDAVPAGTGSTTKFGLDGGAGLNFGVGRIGAFLEGRFHNIFTDGPNTNFVTVDLGVRFGTQGTGTSTTGM
jgi:Outer membrane protein beta-barrel domain